ncbi:MAG: CopG family transcriptional regulator [Candidatus Bathyarchaeia archaeon]
MGHKVQVSFTDEQWRLIKLAKGRMGATDAEVIRNIVISWLAEKSIISQRVKEDIARGENYAKKVV